MARHESTRQESESLKRSQPKRLGASEPGSPIAKDADFTAMTAVEADDAKLDAEAQAALAKGSEKDGDELLDDAGYKITRNERAEGMVTRKETREAGSPTANLRKAAKRTKDEGDVFLG